MIRLGRVMDFILREIREDKDFVGRLESVAGIGPALSLLIDGYEKYQKFKFEQLAYSQQAYFHLSKFVLEIAKDSVMDLEKGGQLQHYSVNIILENIIKKVKDAESKLEYYSDSRDIAGLSIVRELRESIEDSLRQAGAGKDTITEFYTNFNSLVDECSIRSEKAQSFYQWLDRVIKEDTILKHLERLEREFSEYTYSNVEPPLSRYYVEDQHAILDDFRRIEGTTVSIDEDNNDIKATESEDKSAYDLVNEFLDESQQRFIIIGASFGVGKTSLCRYLAAKYARQCKEKPDLFGLDYYVPILVWLEESRNGLISIKSARSVADIINEIASGEGSNRARSERRILLILDGLDQYQWDQPLIDTINELCEEYKKLKVVITTRLEEKETAKKKLFGENH